MRLQSQNRKRTTIIIIVVVAVILIAALVIGAVLLLNKPEQPAEEMKPDTILGIELSSKPRDTVYLVGAPFNPEGTKIQVLTHDQSKTYFVDYTQLSFSGFDSSSVGEKVITVTYKGFTTTFTVTVKEVEQAAPVLTSIRMGDSFQTTYNKDYWNTFGPKLNTATLILTYSDGSEKEVYMESGFCSGIDKNITSAGTTTFTVTCVDAGIVVSTTVTVTITE